MTTFAEKELTYSDGQVNVIPLPEAVMVNGFIPETRDAPGMPLPAQYLNWLFRDVYRHINSNTQSIENNNNKNTTATNQLTTQINKLNTDLTHQINGVKNTANTAIANLLPAWAPVPCPMTTPPAGWLKCDGSNFDVKKYPELAKGYPSGKLPDLRGEFIRGWDDGRRVDANRTILSLQYSSIQQHIHGIKGTWLYGNAPIGATASFTSGPHSSSGDRGPSGNLLSSMNTTEAFGSSETRPRNIAFLYIVRAA